ncbi:acyltransferase family protein [Plesiomonas sp. ZOR0011]|uniref:acyltransferase family protein n=1 Tax=Plesiomonas sp. ZOR0011 TaxID=1339230 RepID=UPI000645F65E|nr:acyltransferase family protein [Plesiomonas sp. ZOR0011]
MSDIKYRPDIDGLRAVAVLMVILFHMNADWIPGGFIGVDVFFVISGYIITSAIYPRILNDEFSFNHFYVRRIKRILPLFYLVVMTSLFFAYFFFTPNDFVGFADSLRYASSFISNVYFEKHSGYFAPASETLPLLHTWSLSLEEQFYFIWPMALILITRSLTLRCFWFVISSSLVGLIAYSEYMARLSGSSSYYLIQSRAFEFLIGAFLAIMVCKKKISMDLPMGFWQFTGIAGMVSLAFLSFYLNENDIFPGLHALVVTIASALVILSGVSKTSIVSYILSLRPMAFIGRLSYSLYLWHWPVLAFYRYYFISFTIVDAIICGVITVVLSFVSWRWFETPLRNSKIGNLWVYLFYLILPIGGIVMIAKTIVSQDGYPDRFSNSVQEIFRQSSYTFDDDKKRRPQVVDSYPFESTVIGNIKKPITAYVWGDSHAGHFRSFVDVLGKKQGFSALYGGLGGCPPILGHDLIKYGQPEKECSQRNNEIALKLTELKPSMVFLAGRWAMYTETTRAIGEKGSRVYLGDKTDYSESIDNSRRALKEGLEQTISHLIGAGIKPILFEQAPAYSFNPSNCLIKKSTYAWMKGISCDLPLNVMLERQEAANTIIYDIAKKYPQVKVIPVVSLLCDETSCKSQLNNTPLYFDNNHLNYEGGRVLALHWLEINK